MNHTSNLPIKLRNALPSDCSLLKRWDEQPHVIACDPGSDWDWELELGRHLPWREQLMAELNGRPIGMVQIIDPALEETHYWGAMPPNRRAIDIWIGEATDVGKGYGTHIMELTIQRCFASAEVEAILIDPLAGNKPARRFYERLGFALLEYRYFGEDSCAVYRLSRSDWKNRAANAFWSPVLGIIEGLGDI